MAAAEARERAADHHRGEMTGRHTQAVDVEMRICRVFVPGNQDRTTIDNKVPDVLPGEAKLAKRILAPDSTATPDAD